jgi:hypothetical protein
MGADYLATIGLSTEDFEKAYRVVKAIEDKMQADAKKTSAAFKEQSKTVAETGKAWSGFSKIASAFGISLSIGALVNFGKSMINAGAGVKETSDELAISSVRLRQFNQAFLDSGVPIEQSTAALKAMTEQLRKAREGGAEMSETVHDLDDVGVKNLKEADVAIFQIADHLHKATKEGKDLDAELEKIGKVVGGRDAANKLAGALGRGGATLSKAGQGVGLASDDAIQSLHRQRAILEKMGSWVKERGMAILGDWQTMLGSLFTGFTAEEVRKAQATFKAVEASQAAGGKQPYTNESQHDTAAKSMKALDDMIKASEELEKIEGQHGPTIEDQNQLYDAQLKLLEARKQLVSGREESEKLHQLEKEYNALRLQAGQYNFEIDEANKALQRQTDIMQLEIEGNSHLAKFAQARAQFEERIAQAKRAGNSAAVQELEQQQKLTEVQEQLRRYQLGAGGRRKEDAEDRKNRRDVRVIGAREKDLNRALDGLTSGGLTSGGLTSGKETTIGDLSIPATLRKPMGDRDTERHDFRREGESQKSAIQSLSIGSLYVTNLNATNRP